ncbi:hypothetical protein D3C71_1496440 [compost metagenome]
MIQSQKNVPLAEQHRIPDILFAGLSLLHGHLSLGFPVQTAVSEPVAAESEARDHFISPSDERSRLQRIVSPGGDKRPQPFKQCKFLPQLYMSLNLYVHYGIWTPGRSKY